MSIRPDDETAHGTVVHGPWTPTPTAVAVAGPPAVAIEVSPDDVLDADPAGVLDADPEPRSRFGQRLAESANTPVLPLALRDPRQATAQARYVGRELARAATREALRPWRPAWRLLWPTLRGLGRGIRAWWRWAVTADDVRFDHIRRPGAKVVDRREIAEDRRVRLVISGGVVVTAGSGMATAALVVGDWTTYLILASGLTGAWWAGRARGGGGAGGTVLAAGRAPLRPGVPVGRLARSVQESLAADRIEADVAELPGTHRWGWSVAISSEDELTDKAVRAMERRLRARRGAITAVADPGDASRTQLRIVHTDLLANVGAPPHHKPGSLTITKPLDLGKTMAGGHFELDMLRVHTVVVGGTGSGKSSALWTEIDALTACRDVIVLGIDLTGGPVFTAWGDCVQSVATEPEQAQDMLTRLIRVAKARTERLGERARPTLGGPPPGDENWDPSKDGPLIVVVIDEYPVLVDAKIGGKPARLGDLVTTLGRIGRKAAVEFVLAAQKAGKSDLGNTTVRAMAGIQALLPCAAGDVDMLWPGKRAEGWRPDLLRGAVGRHANDAGKAYVWAAGYEDPSANRFYRLTVRGIYTRAIERMQAGLPEWDDFSLRAYESDDDISDLIEREVPQVLRDLADAMDAGGGSKISSADAVRWLADTGEYPGLADYLADGTPEGVKRAQDLLSQMLAPHLSSVQLGGPRNPRGYRRDALDLAIAGEAGPL